MPLPSLSLILNSCYKNHNNSPSSLSPILNSVSYRRRRRCIQLSIFHPFIFTSVSALISLPSMPSSSLFLDTPAGVFKKRERKGGIKYDISPRVNNGVRVSSRFTSPKSNGTPFYWAFLTSLSILIIILIGRIYFILRSVFHFTKVSLIRIVQTRY